MSPLSFKGIPLRSSSLQNTSGHAQNLSVSALRQKIERQQAAVSLSQVLNRQAGVVNTRTTSVTHIGQTLTGPTTSITHLGAGRAVNDVTAAGQADAGADNRRYAYMRKLIKERQVKEAVEAKAAAASKKSGFTVGTGATLRTSGATGLHKQLGQEFRTYRSTYGSLTSQERQVLEKSISGRLAHKTTGSTISRYDKKAMRQDINKARNAGDVSISHAKILKKVVQKLG